VSSTGANSRTVVHRLRVRIRSQELHSLELPLGQAQLQGVISIRIDALENAFADIGNFRGIQARNYIARLYESLSWRAYGKARRIHGHSWFIEIRIKGGDRYHTVDDGSGGRQL